MGIPVVINLRTIVTIMPDILFMDSTPPHHNDLVGPMWMEALTAAACATTIPRQTVPIGNPVCRHGTLPGADCRCVSAKWRENRPGIGHKARRQKSVFLCACPAKHVKNGRCMRWDAAGPGHGCV
jgi:hypothetical protein